MKQISIIIPTYNEEENVPLVYNEIVAIFKDCLTEYQYELIFIDNHSTDRTREKIEDLCKLDARVKAIFNARNFGFNRSVFYGLLQGSGMCSILLFADMQDPPHIIKRFVNEWEMGYKIVIGIKNKSKENQLMFAIRSAYYKFIQKISDIDHITQFDGFGLYDREFIDILKHLEDPMPYLRGIVAELGFSRKEILYEQEKRKHGHSSFGFLKLYETAMLGLTSYSTIIMRLATISGFIMSGISFLIGIFTIIMKLLHWNDFQMGVAAISVGIFFLGSILLFFIGFQGEYILSINTRVMKRPLVIEDKRINFIRNNSNSTVDGGKHT